jgi:hypothetical protein
MVQPASVTHVLVEVGEGIQDLSAAWPPDSIVAHDQAILMEYARADSLAAMTAAVLALRARLDSLLGVGTDSVPGPDTVPGGRR